MSVLRMDGEECSNCEHYVESLISPGKGKCYVQPPVFIGMREGVSMWEVPTVNEDGICSLHYLALDEGDDASS